MWDPTPISALTHRPSLDGNDALPRHIFKVYYLLGTPSGCEYSRDDYSHIGGAVIKRLGH